MYKHIVQSDEWAQVKEKYGSEPVKTGEIYYTKHHIPKTPWYYAYCPRVDPLQVDFTRLKTSLKENKCIALTFDVPNIVKGSVEESKAVEILEQYCRKATRSEFATANYLLDLKPSEEELFKNLHSKHRYNARYALKHGVSIELGETEQDFDHFYELLKSTASRQNYFIRPKKYYQIIWKELHPREMCFILTAKYKKEVLASWMPYGGSSPVHKNLFASNALGWESIRFGKSRGCEVFDMWGAADNPEDKQDPYHGFTNFKAKFNGKHVSYIDSYDLPINRPFYFIFTKANNLRWKLLELGLIK
jgi:lipid II:glycine glycyltransferase (peptidoglycan interpeptide bridge formation enzyme)